MSKILTGLASRCRVIIDQRHRKVESLTGKLQILGNGPKGQKRLLDISAIVNLIEEWETDEKAAA